jgi:hypothetical protein
VARPPGIKPGLEINICMLTCLHCQNPLTGKYSVKFCNRSCSASYTNKSKVKHGKYAVKPCKVCGTETTSAVYCSKRCSGLARRKYKTPEEKDLARKLKGKEVNANYRAKLRDQTPEDADREAILEFYRNCPEGYEVDHIIPISKGGLHSLENLQYLTVSENRKKSNKWPALEDSNL